MPTISTTFYPSLSELLPLEKIPDDLGGIKDGLENVFDSFFYKDFHVSRSTFGDAAYYSLKLIAYKRLGIEIPGTGISIVLWPDDSGTNITAIPISLDYRIEILKYIRGFKLSDFGGSVEHFFDLINGFADIPKEQLLNEAIATFFPQSTDGIQDFIDQFNEDLSPTEPLELADDPNLNPHLVLVQQIESTANGFDFYEVILATLMADINSLSDAVQKLRSLFRKWLGNFDEKRLLKMITPQFGMSITDVVIAIEFPRNILVPLDANDEPLPEPAITSITASGISLNYNTDGGFNIDGSFVGLSLPKSRIGKTHFTIEFDNLKIDYSKTKNLPEAQGYGLPDDYTGMYVETATIGFPANWGHNDANSTAYIKGENVFIGTGGITGTFSMFRKAGQTGIPIVKVAFGGFEISLIDFSLTFQQGSLIESTINGQLKIPKLKDSQGNDAEIDVQIHIGEDGDFWVTASEDDGINALQIEGILTLTLNSLRVGREEGRFFLETSGVLDFQDQDPNAPEQNGNEGSSFIGDNLPKDIEFEKLKIWEDGSLEFVGGAIEMAKPITLEIGPVKLTITAIHFGSHERYKDGVLRKYAYFGFDGGVSVNPGGVDARGEGIKFYFSTDGLALDVFVRISGIGIDIIIPGDEDPEEAALLLSGYLAMKEPDPNNPEAAAGTEYIGGVDFTLPKMEIGGSAGMRFTPSVPAFLVDIGIDMATPIVLGSTGLGIYGFRALLGQRYMASKLAIPGMLPDDPWWQYYKAKISPSYKEGVTVDKFLLEQGFSLGAGAAIATVTDSGYAFSSKIFLLLSLPELLMLQGQGQVNKERLLMSSTTDPPFWVLLVITRESIEAAFGANMLIPDTGDDAGSVAVINGVIEMGYFFGDSSAWYINIGKDQPYERRILVRLFDLFDCYYYMMINAGGIRVGAGASWFFEKDVGPLHAEMSAYLDITAKLSFKPKQIGGSIQLGANIELTIFRFGIGLSVAASLAAEAAKPFIITGMLEACIRILGEDRCVNFEFTWNFNDNLDTTEIPLLDSSNLSKAAKAVNIMSKDTLDLNYIPSTTYSSSLPPAPTDSAWNGAFADHIVALDSFVDIEFSKGLKPTGNFGGVTTGAKYVEFSAPQKGKSDRVRHEFHAESIDVYAWDPSLNGGAGGWAEYDMLNALTPPAGSPLANYSQLGSSDLKFGYWQANKPGYYNKLRLMSQTPLSFIAQGGTGGNASEEFGFTGGTIFCEEELLQKDCVAFDDYNTTEIGFGSTIPANTVVNFNGVVLYAPNEDIAVVTDAQFGFSEGARLLPNETLELHFEEAVPCFSLTVKTTDSATVKYYKKSLKDQETGYTGLPDYEYIQVGSTQNLNDQSNELIEYDDQTDPVDRVVIEAGICEGNPTFSTLTTEAGDLEEFLDTLASNSHLTSASFLINPDEFSTYDGIFLDTSLYTLADSEDNVTYKATVASDNKSMHAIIYDDISYFCDLNLAYEGAETDFNMANVSVFKDLEMDTNDTTIGDRYSFLVTADIDHGGRKGVKSYELKGDSCYKVGTVTSPDCETLVYQTCWQTLGSYLYNLSIPGSAALAADNDGMLDSLEKTVQPIWRPDTKFAIKVNTIDKVYRSTGSTLLTEHKNSFTYGFQTAGPIGHFHKMGPEDNATTRSDYAALEGVDREDEYKLAGLRHYINNDRSYPAPDGNIINAKPMFYQNPSLSMFFTKSYIYTMFSDWQSNQGNSALSSELQAIIKDPAEPDVLPTGDVRAPQYVSGNWSLDTVTGMNSQGYSALTPEIELLNNLIYHGSTSTGCNVPSNPIAPPHLSASFDMQALLPLKLYTAVLNAVYIPGASAETREVHRYNFQTSRYADFADQVNSYIQTTGPDTGDDLREMVFEVDRTFDDTTAGSILAGTLANTSSLITEFANEYDRLIDGVFKLGDLHPAVTTEFNVIKDGSTILGILIRNPEPFNDPRMPDADVADTITLSINGDATSKYKAIFSKDRSEMFVTRSNNSLSMDTGDYAFSFKYKTFDGQDYTVSETVNVELSNVN